MEDDSDAEDFLATWPASSSTGGTEDVVAHVPGIVADVGGSGVDTLTDSALALWVIESGKEVNNPSVVMSDVIDELFECSIDTQVLFFTRALEKWTFDEDEREYFEGILSMLVL
jgi:hypothetical protein